MTRRRALLTDRERELIVEKESSEDSHRYQAVSRIRNKIQNELTEDVDILRENHPQLFSELQQIVCDES